MSLTHNFSFSCHIMGPCFGWAANADGDGTLGYWMGLLLTESPHFDIPRPVGEERTSLIFPALNGSMRI